MRWRKKLAEIYNKILDSKPQSFNENNKIQLIENMLDVCEYMEQIGLLIKI